MPIDRAGAKSKPRRITTGQAFLSVSDSSDSPRLPLESHWNELGAPCLSFDFIKSIKPSQASMVN